MDGALPSPVRNARLVPLNDLYALATGSLLSDCIQFFETSAFDYEPRCVVADVMDAIGYVHTSFTIHREVLESLPSTELVEPTKGLREVLLQLLAVDKRLFIVTNSPLWYLEPQMRLFVGDDWRCVPSFLPCWPPRPQKRTREPESVPRQPHATPPAARLTPLARSSHEQHPLRRGCLLGAQAQLVRRGPLAAAVACSAT